MASLNGIRKAYGKIYFFLQQALELQRDRLFDYHYISQSPNIFDPLQFARHCAINNQTHALLGGGSGNLVEIQIIKQGIPTLCNTVVYLRGCPTPGLII